MTDQPIPDRKRPSAALWATVALVIVLVGYPLSWGPACWLTGYGERRGITWTEDAYLTIYAPLLWIDERSPKWVRDATYWYCAILYFGPD